MEYYVSPVTMRDRSYGAIFFVATGFHGIHICIGLVFLALCATYMLYGKYRSWTLLRYEMAIWYWHFVDVV
jgi:cytochrome c oxidase subunit 3